MHNEPETGTWRISIHALREEGDSQWVSTSSRIGDFYPRPPRGGRHFNVDTFVDNLLFLSTPSARRATPILKAAIPSLIDFYPRPPRGGRRYNANSKGGIEIFLSTPSARRATACEFFVVPLDLISIHALREEGDTLQTLSSTSTTYFYPRPPRGGRQQKQRQNLYFQTNYTTFCTNLEEP